VSLRRSIYKSPAQLRAMVEPGLITAAALDAVRDLIAPGVTTGELDAAASAVITARGAKSNFQMVRGYRHTICASVNEQVVHGIPGSLVLQPGDIVSVDCGAQYQGWNGDSAVTFVVPDDERPELVERRTELSRVTEGSMWAGIAAMATATHIGDLGTAIEGYIEAQGPSAVSGETYGILREYVGHGIGRKMHESPSVFNYRVADPGPEVRPGLVLAIEPMVTMGSPDTRVLADDWTVVTTDRSWAAHAEHTVALTETGLWVLTALDGGQAKLSELGVPFGGAALD
jgi:methionyl aminopeptidase